MKRVSLLVLSAAALFCLDSAKQTAFAQVELDDFESGIRIVNPDESDPSVKYLWNQYPNDFYAGPDPGTASITTSTAHHGKQSVAVNVTGGNIYFQFYPAKSDWGFMHEYASGWSAGKYNAIRFWVKIPQQMKPNSAGHENVQVGTYVRGQNDDRHNQGTHYYHFYNFKYTGEWEQVILDTHPTYLLGGGGDNEVGDKTFPFGGNWTYTDALTRFYFDGQGGLSGTPATFYFDNYELITRPANENIDQVYSVHAVYVPSKNEVDVGWSRRKDQDSLTYEVRYSFSDIYSSGWDAATPAPNGTIKGNGLGAYNTMDYSTTGINVSGKNTIYVAIKPTSASKFRQIAIPITSSGSASPPPSNPVAPNPPSDVQVQ